MIDRVRELIALWDMKPHPEGGYYREVFRSAKRVRDVQRNVDRSACTSIYFLLTRGEFSRWHAVLSDETWHFFEGAPLEIVTVDASLSGVTAIRMGTAGGDAMPMRTVTAGTWQAARVLGDYALVGCTVSPGFEFGDFTLLSSDSSRAASFAAAFPAFANLL